jgi:hypothetical protein
MRQDAFAERVELDPVVAVAEHFNEGRRHRFSRHGLYFVGAQLPFSMTAVNQPLS